MLDDDKKRNNVPYSPEAFKITGLDMPTADAFSGWDNVNASTGQGDCQQSPNINIPPELIQQATPESTFNHGSLNEGTNQFNSYILFPDLPVNVRAANQAILKGQPIEGREVFWQYDSNKNYYCFWQEFDKDTAIFWNAIDPALVYFYRKKSGENIGLNGVIFGSWDNLSMWVPQYSQLTTLDILIKNEFSSIKPQEMFSLITLVSYADSLGVVNGITIRQLSDLTGYSKDTTLRHIESLRRSKVIKEVSKVSKLKKKGQLQEKQPRSYKILLGSELAELDGVSFKQLEDRMS